MVSIKLIFVTVLAVSLPLAASAQRAPSLTFADLASYKAADQTFTIVGSVLDIYTCPPCPKGAMCKPCIPNNITVVEKIDRAHLSSLKRLRIYTHDAGKFAPGERCLFTVKVFGNLEEGKPINDVTLLRFEQLPLGDPLM